MTQIPPVPALAFVASDRPEAQAARQALIATGILPTTVWMSER